MRQMSRAGTRSQLRSRLKAAGAAFASNAINSNLRRAQLSFFGAWTAEWAFTVGLGIVAYRAGGPTAVGLVGLLRMVPSALIAPLAAPLADRGRRERVLVLVSIARGVATGAAGIVVALDGPVVIVYVLAALSTIAATLFRPAPPRGAHLMADVAEGIRAVVGNRDLALFTGLGMAQTFTRGALTVFTVVVALDLLRTGEPGVGTMNGAISE